MPELYRVIRGIGIFLLILTPGLIPAGIMGLSAGIGGKGPRATLNFIPITFYVTTMFYPVLFGICWFFASLCEESKNYGLAITLLLIPLVIPLILFLLMTRLPPRLFEKPDMDVTADPQYNFQPLVGTVWKTKIKMALANIAEEQWKNELTLLEPQAFDRAHRKYTPPPYMKKIDAELPIGTRLRIERLMLTDTGNVNYLRIAASLDDGKKIYLSKCMNEKNKFDRRVKSESNEWKLNPVMFEKGE
ncbi:MAG: hypothetical protein JNJ77_08580 [Planctomycetia bacterium]|nr:hypothetical protein [Planctomycetia bacterium]